MAGIQLPLFARASVRRECKSSCETMFYNMDKSHIQQTRPLDLSLYYLLRRLPSGFDPQSTTCCGEWIPSAAFSFSLMAKARPESLPRGARVWLFCKTPRLHAQNEGESGTNTQPTRPNSIC
ncbi:uncharacterized protein SPSK_04672 [Sporothrix schenckii 1099-18]|uniref:Uncharacterized protein n=1 Tax=Sporothrix schenckii 1099-18 TaxID=1397361 RepID=A0A0F2M029_SPOSC|nr:uncharacterized protein SPSK_04672 [Sporothrix schenckii 1099-18]KJR83068.1 hypothetical protein SPSK_04672 [Sporothrix schenckii 1099-18]